MKDKNVTPTGISLLRAERDRLLLDKSIRDEQEERNAEAKRLRREIEQLKELTR